MIKIRRFVPIFSHPTNFKRKKAFALIKPALFFFLFSFFSVMVSKFAQKRNTQKNSTLPISILNSSLWVFSNPLFLLIVWSNKLLWIKVGIFLGFRAIKTSHGSLSSRVFSGVSFVFLFFSQNGKTISVFRFFSCQLFSK